MDQSKGTLVIAMTNITPEIGIHEGVPATEYHTWRALSSTWLKTWVASSAAHANTEDLDPDKPAYRLGVAVHARLLEPQAYYDLIAVAPQCDRRTTAGKELWASFLSGVNGRTVIDEEMQDTVNGIRRVVESMRSCRETLASCEDRELSLVAEVNGVLSKARLDAYDANAGLILDVKTTSVRVPEFARQAYNLNYALQMAWYRAVAQASGLTVNRCGILICETNKPWGCQVALLPNAILDYADAAVASGCVAWSECQKTGVFPLYEDKVIELEMPAWASRQMEGTVDV
jgi:hypothetical protein